jgi:hypothetical protein
MSLSYPELNRHRKEVDSRSLSNRITPVNAVKVYIRRLDNSLLALHGLKNLFGEAVLGFFFSQLTKAGLPGESSKKEGQEQEASLFWGGFYRKPAYAIDRVADPAPSFALTTSSPPN